jgi:hypothetical protein
MDEAFVSPGFEAAPYEAKAASDRPSGFGWWMVVNANGINVLSFYSQPGAKFTSEGKAKSIAEKWNAGAGNPWRVGKPPLVPE